MNLLVIILAATIFNVEPVNGSVDFSITKWGVFRKEGTFREFSAQIHYDERDVSKSHVSFDVKTASIDTNNEGRDSVVRSDDFLHVAKYPRMTFRSVRVVARGKNVADVTGDLTIRGVTRRITIPVRLTAKGKDHRGRDIASFETSFTVDRRDFGVNGTRWSGGKAILGTDVEVRIVAGAVSR